MTPQQVTPLISIIMPAYNAANYIGQAIESVLAQTYSNWELLVVDDDSTDETGAIVQSYIDSRIQYIRVERIGSPSGVRNVGLKASQGELISFLDADDLYYPNALDMLSKALINDPERTAVFGFPNHIDEHGNSLPNPISLRKNQGENYSLPSNYKKSWKEIVAGNVICLLAALMLRRSTLERVGLFNEKLYGPEDFEFYLKIYLDNFEGFHCLPAYIYEYRIHSASLTKTPENMTRVLQSSLDIVQWLFSEANVPEDVYSYKSLAFTEVYRYLARERLLNQQPELAREILSKSFENGCIKKIDWFAHCFPLMIRSFIPYPLDHFMVTLRLQLRNHIRNSSLINPSLLSS